MGNQEREKVSYCYLQSSLSSFHCREDVKRLVAAYTKEMGQAGLEVAFAEYSSNWESTPSQYSIKRTAVDIGTDYLFLVPTQTAIYLHAANARWGLLFAYFVLTYRLAAAGVRDYEY